MCIRDRALTLHHDSLLEKARASKLRGLLLVSDLPGQQLSEEWIDALSTVEFGLVFLLENDPRIPASTCLFPATAFSEREGSIISEDGQLQLVRAATQLPRGVLATEDLLQDTLSALGARETKISPRGLFNEMAGAIPALAGISHSDLAAAGVNIRGGEK